MRLWIKRFRCYALLLMSLLIVTALPVYAATSDGSDGSNMLICLLAAIVIGCIISFAMTGIKKAALTSVHFEKTANNYVSSEEITKRRDVFLYKNLTVTEKPKDNHKE